MSTLKLLFFILKTWFNVICDSMYVTSINCGSLGIILQFNVIKTIKNIINEIYRRNSLRLANLAKPALDLSSVEFQYKLVCI